MVFQLVPKQNKSCHHDHITFNFKGNEKKSCEYELYSGVYITLSKREGGHRPKTGGSDQKRRGQPKVGEGEQQ